MKRTTWAKCRTCGHVYKVPVKGTVPPCPMKALHRIQFDEEEPYRDRP